MRYTPRQADSAGNRGDFPGTTGPEDTAGLFEILESLVRGLGMSLVELTFSRHRGGGSSAGRIQVRLVVCKAAAELGAGKSNGSKGWTVGVDDCSRVHRTLLPRLELTFPGQDLYVEVSSPGIDRVIKDGAEFVHYIGRGVKCYRTDISDWTGGILRSADEKGVVLKGKDGMTEIAYEVIAKAKLDDTLDYLREV
jgi:ribosome maturation factor RimP